MKVYEVLVLVCSGVVVRSASYADRSRQRRDLGSGHHEHGEHHHHHDEHHASENEVDTGDDWKKYLLPPYMPLPPWRENGQSLYNELLRPLKKSKSIDDSPWTPIIKSSDPVRPVKVSYEDARIKKEVKPSDISANSLQLSPVKNLEVLTAPKEESKPAKIITKESKAVEIITKESKPIEIITKESKPIEIVTKESKLVEIITKSPLTTLKTLDNKAKEPSPPVNYVKVSHGVKQPPPTKQYEVLDPRKVRPVHRYPALTLKQLHSIPKPKGPPPSSKLPTRNTKETSRVVKKLTSPKEKARFREAQLKSLTPPSHRQISRLPPHRAHQAPAQQVKQALHYPVHHARAQHSRLLPTVQQARHRLAPQVHHQRPQTRRSRRRPSRRARTFKPSVVALGFSTVAIGALMAI